LSAVTIALASTVVVIGGRARLRRFEGTILVVTGTAMPDGHPKEFFSVVHGLLRTGLARWREGQPPIGFEIIGRASEVRLRAWVAVRLVVRPKARRWSARARARAQAYRDRRRGRGFGVAQHDRARALAIEEKAAEAPFDACLEIASAAGTWTEATDALESTVATFAVFAGANRFVFSKPGRVGRGGVSRRRRFPFRGAMVLTA